MKIISVSGTLDNSKRFPRFWKNLEDSFAKYFPKARFILHTSQYLPWETEKMKSYGKEIVALFDDGEDIILLGHSIGGVIATIISLKFKKSKVRLLVTLNSPHKLESLYKKIDENFDMEKVKVPTASFSSILDPIVPFFIAKHPKGNIHNFFIAEHVTTFIFFPKLCDKIAETSLLVFNNPEKKFEDKIEA